MAKYDPNNPAQKRTIEDYNRIGTIYKQLEEQREQERLLREMERSNLAKALGQQQRQLQQQRAEEEGGIGNFLWNLTKGTGLSGAGGTSGALGYGAEMANQYYADPLGTTAEFVLGTATSPVTVAMDVGNWISDVAGIGVSKKMKDFRKLLDTPDINVTEFYDTNKSIFRNISKSLTETATDLYSQVPEGWGGTIGNAFGSIIPMALTAIATRNPKATMAVGSMMMGGEYMQENEDLEYGDRARTAVPYVAIGGMLESIEGIKLANVLKGKSGISESVAKVAEQTIKNVDNPKLTSRLTDKLNKVLFGEYTKASREFLKQGNIEGLTELTQDLILTSQKWDRMKPEEQQQYLDNLPSQSWKTFASAFLVGGSMAVVGGIGKGKKKTEPTPDLTTEPSPIGKLETALFNKTAKVDTTNMSQEEKDLLPERAKAIRNTIERQIEDLGGDIKNANIQKVIDNYANLQLADEISPEDINIDFSTYKNDIEAGNFGKEVTQEVKPEEVKQETKTEEVKPEQETKPVEKKQWKEKEVKEVKPKVKLEDRYKAISNELKGLESEYGRMKEGKDKNKLREDIDKLKGELRGIKVDKLKELGRSVKALDEWTALQEKELTAEAKQPTPQPETKVEQEVKPGAKILQEYDAKIAEKTTKINELDANIKELNKQINKRVKEGKDDLTTSDLRDRKAELFRQQKAIKAEKDALIKEGKDKVKELSKPKEEAKPTEEVKPTKEPSTLTEADKQGGGEFTTKVRVKSKVEQQQEKSLQQELVDMRNEFRALQQEKDSKAKRTKLEEMKAKISETQALIKQGVTYRSELQKEGKETKLLPAPKIETEVKPEVVKEEQTQPQTEVQDATKKGEVTEGNKPEYPQGNKGGKTKKTGNSDKPKQGRKEQKEVKVKEEAKVIKKEVEVAETDIVDFVKRNYSGSFAGMTVEEAKTDAKKYFFNGKAIDTVEGFAEYLKSGTKIKINKALAEKIEDITYNVEDPISFEVEGAEVKVKPKGRDLVIDDFASNEEMKPALMGVTEDATKGFIYSTDGLTLIRVKDDTIKESIVRYTKKALDRERATLAKIKSMEDVEAEIGKRKASGTVPFGKQPDFESVIPKSENMEIKDLGNIDKVIAKLNVIADVRTKDDNVLMAKLGAGADAIFDPATLLKALVAMKQLGVKEVSYDIKRGKVKFMDKNNPDNVTILAMGRRATGHATVDVLATPTQPKSTAEQVKDAFDELKKDVSDMGKESLGRLNDVTSIAGMSIEFGKAMTKFFNSLAKIGGIDLPKIYKTFKQDGIKLTRKGYNNLKEYYDKWRNNRNDKKYKETRKRAGDTEYQKLEKDNRQWMRDTFVPISARLKAISPKLFTIFRRQYYNELRKQSRRMKKVKDYLVGTALAETKLKDTKEWNRYQRLLGFEELTPELQKELEQLESYISEQIGGLINLTEERKKVDEVLAEMGDELVSINAMRKRLKTYFPLRVADYEGLHKYIEKVKGKTELAKATEGLNEYLIPFIEQAKDVDGKVYTIVNMDKLSSYLRGFTPDALYFQQEKKGLEKRKIALKAFADEIMQFYKPPHESLSQYIVEMTSYIETAKFIKPSERLSLDFSGDRFDNLVDVVAGELIKNKEDIDMTELKKLLRGRFNPKYFSNSIPKALMKFTTYTMLDDIATTVRNMQDFASLVYTGYDISTTGITLDFLGLSAETISDINALGDRGKWGDRFLFGLRKTEDITSQRLVDASVNSTISMANKILSGKKLNDKEAKIYDMVKVIRGEAGLQAGLREIARYGKELSEGKTPAPNYLVGELAFNSILDLKPIGYLEMPYNYSQHPSSKFLYSMKSYKIKQLTNMYQQSIGLMRNKNTFGRGLRNIMRYNLALQLAKIPTTIIVSLMTGGDWDEDIEWLQNFLAGDYSDGLLELAVGHGVEIIGLSKYGFDKLINPRTSDDLIAGISTTTIPFLSASLAKGYNIGKDPERALMLIPFFGKSIDKAVRRMRRQEKEEEKLRKKRNKKITF